MSLHRQTQRVQQVIPAHSPQTTLAMPSSNDAADSQPPPVSVHDFRVLATERLPRPIRGYYNSGAGNELTLRDNCTAFSRIQLRPRFLRDVSARSTDCTVLGHQLRMPIAIAPTAMQRMAHPDGELATVRAAGQAGTIYTMSTLATSSIEEVAAAAPASTIKWFQLYIYRDRTLTQQLVRRAEAAGFSAIVLTVDTPLFGVRHADMRNRFALPAGLNLRNFDGMSTAGSVPSTSGASSTADNSGIAAYANDQFDATLTWRDVRWLVGFTRLPVLVKGVLTAEDAVLAVESGCSGVIVSNHGARQLDTVQSTIDVLPEIVRAVGSRCSVMLDGGIRDGTDVFKALALGASCVFVGRPVIWGLAVDGQRGVERVLEILRDEFDRAMALSGVLRPDQITAEYVLRRSAL